MPFLTNTVNSSKNIEINISNKGIFEDFKFATLRFLNGEFFKVFNIFIKISFDNSVVAFLIFGKISIVVPSFVCITPT